MPKPPEIGSAADLYRLISAGKLALEMLHGKTLPRPQPEGFDMQNACKGVANGIARDLANWIVANQGGKPKIPEAD